MAKRRWIVEEIDYPAAPGNYDGYLCSRGDSINCAPGTQRERGLTAEGATINVVRELKPGECDG